MSLAEFLGLKKVLLCVGSGGVGKTTTAAAIAVKLARSGRKVMVCTIDPAKRLASSLGISGLDNAETLVRDYGSGQLWAMMLDVKATFDEVIGRYARDAEARDRILANDYYKFASTRLSLSQEFMAVEKLHELYESKRYDVIVLDTPPTQNTIDFLKMPLLITAIMDERVVRWLMKPYQLMSRKGFNILALGAEKAFEALGSIFGLTMLRDLSEFVSIMQGLVDGFHARAARIRELITAVETGFVIVATARDRSVEEALFFYKEIEGMKADVIGIILNRLQWPNGSPPIAELEAALGQLPAELQAAARIDLATVAALGGREEANHDRLAEEVPRGIIQRIPQFPRDIHDLEGLELYADLLR